MEAPLNDPTNLKDVDAPVYHHHGVLRAWTTIGFEFMLPMNEEVETAKKTSAQQDKKRSDTMMQKEEPEPRVMRCVQSPKHNDGWDTDKSLVWGLFGCLPLVRTT